MDINTIVDIAIKLVGTCIVMVISKTCIPWLKEQSTYSTVKKFVQAAEKLASAGKIQKADKKAYVLQLLSSSGIKVTAEVEAMVESAVEELDWMTCEITSEILSDSSDEKTE